MSFFSPYMVTAVGWHGNAKVPCHERGSNFPYVSTLCGGHTWVPIPLRSGQVQLVRTGSYVGTLLFLCSCWEILLSVSDPDVEFDPDLVFVSCVTLGTPWASCGGHPQLDLAPVFVREFKEEEAERDEWKSRINLKAK